MQDVIVLLPGHMCYKVRLYGLGLTELISNYFYMNIHKNRSNFNTLKGVI